MDTGEEVTVISEDTYDALQRPTLDKPSRVLYGPARLPLDVLGQFRGNMTQGPSQHLENIYVVRNLRNNLLGLPAITALKLIQRVDATYSGKEDVLERFPKVFTGLGTMGEDYTIRLEEGARPRSLLTPRSGLPSEEASQGGTSVNGIYRCHF